uniref:HDC17406 n=1 Tax=Drosophila melanogaster TaxID=7227 RepID=Q6IIP6_DROME|nr:TPA_inf: HDC17406 [Drosophila melanogaster]
MFPVHELCLGDASALPQSQSLQDQSHHCRLAVRFGFVMEFRMGYGFGLRLHLRRHHHEDDQQQQHQHYDHHLAAISSDSATERQTRDEDSDRYLYLWLVHFECTINDQAGSEYADLDSQWSRLASNCQRIAEIL